MHVVSTLGGATQEIQSSAGYKEQRTLEEVKTDLLVAMLDFLTDQSDKHRKALGTSARAFAEYLGRSTKKAEVETFQIADQMMLDKHVPSWKMIEQDCGDLGRKDLRERLLRLAQGRGIGRYTSPVWVIE